MYNILIMTIRFTVIILRHIVKRVVDLDLKVYISFVFHSIVIEWEIRLCST